MTNVAQLTKLKEVLVETARFSDEWQQFRIDNAGLGRKMEITRQNPDLLGSIAVFYAQFSKALKLYFDLSHELGVPVDTNVHLKVIDPGFIW